MKPGVFSQSLKTRAFQHASNGLIVAQFLDILDKSLILHRNCPFCAHNIAHSMKTGNFCFHSCPLTELIDLFLLIISQTSGPFGPLFQVTILYRCFM